MRADDYGTGYSSLAYLRHLPADELKLDRAFTFDLDTDPHARAIVRHTVSLAHDLGLRVVAEGIETPAVAASLADLGCDIGQGYLFARPMPVAAFLRWIDNPEGPADRTVSALTTLAGPTADRCRGREEALSTTADSQADAGH